MAQCGIFLAVLYWMLRAWMPARWALFGVLLAGLRFAVGSYWINNLHGGFLPAIGGALVTAAQLLDADDGIRPAIDLVYRANVRAATELPDSC